MKRSIFTTLRLFFRRTWTILVFAAAIANFFLSCSVSRMARPQYIYHTVTNEIVRTSIVTQLVSSADSSYIATPFNFPSSDVSSSPSSSSSPRSISTTHYRYTLVGGRRAVMLFGRMHYLGSRTSYGRIVDIFPDRVILDSGITINNQNLERTENDYGTTRPTSFSPGNSPR